jgi:hypothetical protein
VKTRSDTAQWTWLIDQVLRAERTPRELAEELGIPPSAVPALVAGLNLEALAGGWRELHELRAALLISQLRSSAAVRLAQFLAGDDSETVRKACVDLLKAGQARGATSRAASSSSSDSSWPSPPSPEIEERVLAELARMGRAALDGDGDVDADAHGHGESEPGEQSQQSQAAN